jgi:hypothetical protein
MVTPVRIPQNAGAAPRRRPAAPESSRTGGSPAAALLCATLLSAAPAAAVAMAAGLMLPEPAAAAVTHLTVPVRGMTCALCTRGVEESIRSLGGLEAKADLAAGRVRVEAAPGKSLVVRDVRERILSAGFGIGGELQGSAVGRFVIGADRRITFKVSNTAYAFQVLEGEQLRRMFRKTPGLTGEFLVHFRLHDHPHWNPPAIAITGFERRSPTPGPAAR